MVLQDSEEYRKILMLTLLKLCESRGLDGRREEEEERKVEAHLVPSPPSLPFTSSSTTDSSIISSNQPPQLGNLTRQYPFVPRSWEDLPS